MIQIDWILLGSIFVYELMISGFFTLLIIALWGLHRLARYIIRHTD